MNASTMEDNELLFYGIPENVLPGNDTLSKRILSNQKIIDIIARSLLEIPPGTYGTASTEWHNNTRSDILYVPKLDIQRHLPPILIEIQATVDEKFMLRLMKYAISVVERFSVKPLIVIFCINNFSPKSLVQQFKSKGDNKYLKEIPCGIWAEQCLLLFEKGEELDDDPLQPVQAISSFFCQQKATFFDHTYSDDATIKFLYKISKEITEEETEYEGNYRHALEVVLQSNKKCFEKTNEITSGGANINKIQRLVDKGLDYNNSVKKQLYNDDSDSDIELELPVIPPDKSNTQEIPTQLESEIGFVKAFKNKTGRMNWRKCLEEAHEAKLLTRYSTGESLRVNFSGNLNEKPLNNISNNHY